MLLQYNCGSIVLFCLGVVSLVAARINGRSMGPRLIENRLEVEPCNRKKGQGFLFRNKNGSHPDQKVETRRTICRHPRGVMRLGPVQVSPKSPTAFVWKAEVNRSTGLASSREVSEIPTGSPLGQALLLLFNGANSSNCDSASSLDWRLKSLSEKLFRSYFSWLGDIRVSFGLIRAVSLDDDQVEIRDRFLGIGLLRFGRPRSDRYSVPGVENPTAAEHDRNHKPNRSSSQMIPPALTTIYLCSFPITGGILQVSDTSRNKSQTGNLLFALKTTMPNQTHDRLGKTAGWINPSVHHNHQTYLQTELVDYRPILVGSRTPSRAIRTALYLGSQSLIHAYVMWRFHAHCRNLDSDQIRFMAPLLPQV